MFFADTHTHSQYSFDGSSTVEQMLEGARQNNVSVLCLTEHCDFWPGRRCPHYARHETACQEEMLSRRQGATMPELLYGVELGQPQQNPSAARALLAAHDYDMVIGSIHALSDGRDIYATPYPDLAACRGVFDLYFDDMARLLDFGDFDTLGHLDYPLRVMGGAWPAPTLAEYKERIAPLLRELARQGKALEVNAKGCREWLGAPGPELWALELFAQYGGKLLTTGSDAHSAQNCGAGLKQANALIRQAGFTRIVTFRHRKPCFHPI